MNKDRKRRIFARKTPEVTREERAHEKLARSLAGECMVLLKNERRDTAGWNAPAGLPSTEMGRAPDG